MSANVGYATLTVIPSAKGALGNLQAEFGAPLDAAGDKAGTTSSKKFGSKFTSGISGAMKTAGAALGIAAVAGFAKSAVSAASNVEESMSKVKVVFGDSSDAVINWSQTSATSMGQSQAQALAAVGTFGNLLTGFGVGEGQTTKMSESMVQLATDLASFNNTSVDDALSALQSGLTGETEPLKKFGVALNDAALKNEALKLGLIATTDEAMSPAVKAQASYALIMASTGTAQGDFARTSEGLANQQKVLGAKFDDVKAKLGAVLLPIFTKVTNFLSGNMKPVLIGLGVVIGVLFTAWAVGAAAAAAASIAAAAPFIAIGVAVAAVAAAVVYAYNNFGWFKTAVDAVASFFTDTLWPILQDVGSFLADAFSAAIGAAATAFGAISTAVSTLWGWLQTLWDRAEPLRAFLADAFSAAIGVATTAFGIISTAVSTLWGWLQTLWDRSEPLRGFLAGAFKAGLDVIVTTFGIVSTAVSTLWGWLQTLWNRSEPLRAFMVGAFKLGLDVVTTTFGIVSTAVSTLWGWLQTLWDRAEPLRAFLADAFATGVGVATAAFDLLTAAVDFVWAAIQLVWDKSDVLRSFFAGAFKLGIDAVVLLWGTLRAAIDLVWGAIQTVWDKTETLRSFLAGAFATGIAAAKVVWDGFLGVIGAVWQKLKDIVQAAKDAIAAVKDVPKNAWTGVFGSPLDQPGNAAGTNFWQGGPTWVGERGRELIWANRGAVIKSNADSEQWANGFGTGGPPPIVVNNNRRDIGVADLNFVLAMARLAS